MFGRICSFPERNVCPPCFDFSWYFAFSFSHSPYLSMGTVFHIPLLSHEEEKKLAVESDKDSEGSYENIILPQ